MLSNTHTSVQERSDIDNNTLVIKYGRRHEAATAEYSK